MLKSAPMRSRLIFPALLLLAVALIAQTAQLEITAEPHHHQIFENQFVRVFKVEVPPQEATLLHTHNHDYVFVTLGPAEIENDVQGQPPATVKLQDGETRFTPGNFAHLVRDVGATPFRNVTIEFLQDEAARKNPPPPWDEERGLNVLMGGGTQDIMFVKDGVRVSEIDLNPGADVPSHHHVGPHLAVAITDLDLRSDVEGQSPTTLHLKSGEVKWIPGNLTHSVTNVGKQQAKLITLEFH